MNDYQSKLIETAQAEIRVVETLIPIKAYAAAISRSYYAMFYLAQALLDTKRLSFSKHSAVISAFGKEFSKSGLIDQCFHGYLIQAQEDRLKADYDIMHVLNLETAETHLQRTKAFLEMASSFLAAQ